jgi:hypothetical protein
METDDETVASATWNQRAADARTCSNCRHFDDELDKNGFGVCGLGWEEKENDSEQLAYGQADHCDQGCLRVRPTFGCISFELR